MVSVQYMGTGTAVDRFGMLTLVYPPLTSNSTGSVVLQSPHALVRLKLLGESVL